MYKDNNIANCAYKVFNIYQTLYRNDSEQNELIQNFSADSLLLYFNSLKKAGIKLKHPNKSNKKYHLENRLNFIIFEEMDFKFLNKFKILLGKKSDYASLIKYNEFLIELTNYVGNKQKAKLIELSQKKPLNYQKQKLLAKLEHNIKNRLPIKIIYQTATKTIKYFSILPQYIQIKNSTLYLWGQDNSLKEIRCLKIDNILQIQNLTEVFDENLTTPYVLLEVSDPNPLLANNNIFKVVSKTKNKYIYKFYFKNYFELSQQILNLGSSCKIIEPVEIKKIIKEKLLRIKQLYEK